MAADPIGIAGAGRVAQALGCLLRQRGEPVAAIASRDFEHARQAAAFIESVEAVSYSALPRRAARILIAVSDDALPRVARLLAESGMKTGAVLHTCGARGPDVLAPLEANGVSCATLHPLQTFATPAQGVAALPGSAFGISGVGPAAAWAEQIAVLLGGRALRIPPANLPLYHAAAVIASNYVVALVDAAAILMEAAGVAQDVALAAIAPLVTASGANALNLGPTRALTGPLERGDVETISRHSQALAAAPPTVRRLYRAAALQVLAIARRRGLPEARAAELEELLLKSVEDDA